MKTSNQKQLAIMVIFIALAFALMPLGRDDVINTSAMSAAEVITSPIQAYMFRVANTGERVYSPASVIPAGSLIKLSACVNGYAQVEFQRDDGWWMVQYLRCR